jgi:DNA-binding transcriptional MerR regulator
MSARTVPTLYLNRKEAAKACGVSPATISRWKNSGKLRAKKTAERGGRELYTPEDLKRCVESLEDA